MHYESLAIRDYWSLGEEGGGDDKFVVLVVDEFGGKGNVLNFNVGEGVKFALPNVFWTRLSSKYGTVSGLQFMCFVLCSISVCFSIRIKLIHPVNEIYRRSLLKKMVLIWRSLMLLRLLLRVCGRKNSIALKYQMRDLV